MFLGQEGSSKDQEVYEDIVIIRLAKASELSDKV